MEIELFTYDCIGCGRCVEYCPRGVLRIVENGMCCFVNVANADLCTGCRRCEKACPTKAIHVNKPDYNFFRRKRI
ncbi:4Fe-4S dicluster domain-containing protein [Bacteroides reticulotermitis]|uniref:4Fe-4S dicluster domain-containing protein n=1 Tax=Bacteroides reticulotermitis TaxID=1133319 RepID=UPI0009DE531E